MKKTKKFTDEYLKILCCEKDLIFVNTEYKMYDNKRRKCLNFICIKHKDKGIQCRPVEKIQDNKKVCSYCNHRKLKETFKNEMEIINPNIEILSDYINWDTKIKCRCKIDNHIWFARVPVLLSGGGCPVCGVKKIWGKRIRITTDDIQERLNKLHLPIEVVGEYNGYNTPLKFKCSVDNCEWESTPARVLGGICKCPQCSEKHLRETAWASLSEDTFKYRLSISNPDIQIKGKYINANTPIEFICVKHNYTFNTSPRTFLYKQGKGCPYCTQSVGERKMLKILENKNHNIQRQYSFDDCVYKDKLRFDAYDLTDNILYEYQGQQHYYPVNFGGISDKRAQEEF